MKTSIGLSRGNWIIKKDVTDVSFVIVVFFRGAEFSDVHAET